jgi:hypothetical protein
MSVAAVRIAACAFEKCTTKPSVLNQTNTSSGTNMTKQTHKQMITIL